MKYPRLTHDQKISTKLSQKEVIQIQNDYLEIPDYKIYAEKYGVSQNCIRYWVDEDYKKKKLASNKKGKQKRYQEIKKRRHDLDLASVSLKKRVERYPKIKAWRIKTIKESNDKK
tara:strand:+ start:1411 stop:1755 length:345 start_codon:yes stop_codon:yes gene_type:complete